MKIFIEHGELKKLFISLLLGIVIHFLIMTPIHEFGHVTFAKIGGARIIEVQYWHTLSNGAHVFTDGNFSSIWNYMLYRLGGQIFYLGVSVPIMIYIRKIYPLIYFNYTLQFLFTISFFDVRYDYQGIGIIPYTLNIVIFFILFIIFSLNVSKEINKISST